MILNLRSLEIWRWLRWFENYFTFFLWNLCLISHCLFNRRQYHGIRLVRMHFKLLGQFGHCLDASHRCQCHFPLNADKCFRLVTFVIVCSII